MRRPLDVQPDEMGREQLDRGIEPMRGRREAEVQVVVINEPSETEGAIEPPDEEAGPDIRPDVFFVRVEVCAEEKDTAGMRQNDESKDREKNVQDRQEVCEVERFIHLRPDRSQGDEDED